jgi:hypothetical protein
MRAKLQLFFIFDNTYKSETLNLNTIVSSMTFICFRIAFTSAEILITQDSNQQLTHFAAIRP